MSTLTKKTGCANLGPETYEATYEVELGTTSAAGLDAIDLTGEFAYVSFIVCGGNDTAGDNAYSIKAIHASATAITSSNVSLEVRNISDGATVDSTDLSAVGALQLLVRGKKA